MQVVLETEYKPKQVIHKTVYLKPAKIFRVQILPTSFDRK